MGPSPIKRTIKMKYILLGGILAIGGMVANLEAFGFLVGGIVAFLTLFLFPSMGLILLIWGLKAKRSHKTTWGATLLLAMAAALISSLVITQAKIKTSKRLGDEMCQALAQYQNTKGEFPERLEDLAPEFLRAIPKTRMGLFRSLPFRYQHKKDQGEYLLGFDSTFFIYFERGPDGSWRSDD